MILTGTCFCISNSKKDGKQNSMKGIDLKATPLLTNQLPCFIPEPLVSSVPNYFLVWQSNNTQHSHVTWSYSTMVVLDIFYLLSKSNPVRLEHKCKSIQHNHRVSCLQRDTCPQALWKPGTFPSLHKCPCQNCSSVILGELSTSFLC